MDRKVAVIQQTFTKGERSCGYEIRWMAWGKSGMCGKPVGSSKRDAEISVRCKGCGKTSSKGLNACQEKKQVHPNDVERILHALG